MNCASGASQTEGSASLCCEGVALRWVHLLDASDVEKLLAVSKLFLQTVGCPLLWETIAETWPFTRAIYDSSLRQKQVPWRQICALQERLYGAWRGAPVSFKLDLKKELRGQKLADLEVMMVDFLAGDEGLVLGHARGGVSIWELSVPDRKVKPSPLQLQAKVIGFFQACRKHDVQDIAVSPPATLQPAALLLGQSVWLSAAVGPNVYIWESSGSPQPGRPVSVLESWTARATLRHSHLFPQGHHAVWSVRFCHEHQFAVTVGEDGVLRAWLFSCKDAGFEADKTPEGSLLWQRNVGDARQVVAAIIPSPGLQRSKKDGTRPGSCPLVVAVARADHRSLDLLDAITGEAAATVADVWPSIAGSLPQAATYDTCGQLALFSSITETGDGVLSSVDISPQLQPSPGPGSVSFYDLDEDQQSAGGFRQAMEQSESSSGQRNAQSPSRLTRLTSSRTVGTPLASPRVSQVTGPLAGPGRVLRHAVAVQAAGVLLAIVNEGRPMDVLEVWEGSDALRDGTARACFRTRLPQFLANRRLIAAGGRRLVLLDPKAFLLQGELKVLEWRRRQAGCADTAIAKASGLQAEPCCSLSTCFRAVKRLLLHVACSS